MTCPTIEAHLEQIPALAILSISDRCWFYEHPGSVFRIRPQFSGELEVLGDLARVAGRPLIDLDPNLTGDHVAVVDLLRLFGAADCPDGESCRCRLPCARPVDAIEEAPIGEQAMAVARRMTSSRRRRGGRWFG